MPLYLWKRYGECPEEVIENFEKARGVRLPPLLRSFLLAHDGGEANAMESQIATKDKSCPVPELLPARVFGFASHGGERPSIPEAIEEIGELIARSGIPFAEDAYGSYLVVDSETEDIELVNLDPNECDLGVGIFPTGLALQDIVGEIQEGGRKDGVLDD